MKNIFVLLFLLSLVSCGKKENKTGEDYQFQEKGEQIIPSDPGLDNDFDGLTNGEEKKLGTDPNIADLPISSLKIESASLQVGESKFLYTEEGRSLFQIQKKSISKHVYNLRYNGLYNISKYDLSDDFSSEERCLNELITIPQNEEEQEINLDFKIDKKDKTIINAEYFVNQYPVDNIFSKQFKISNINEFITDRCLKIIPRELKYNLGKKVIQLSDIKESIETKLAHIIILNKEEVKIYHVNPDQTSMKNLAKKLNLDLQLSEDGERVISLDGLVSDYEYDDQMINDENYLTYGKWFFLSSNHKSLKENFIAGETYILSYLKLEDLISIAPKIYEASFNHKIKLNSVKAGDEVTISGTYGLNFPIPSSQGKTTIHFNSATLNNLKNKRKKSEEIKLSIGHSSRVLHPFIQSNKLLFKFKVSSKDLNEGFLDLELNQNGQENFSYTSKTEKIKMQSIRAGGSPMHGGGGYIKVPSPYIVEATHTVKEKIQYSMNIKIKGLPR